MPIHYSSPFPLDRASNRYFNWRDIVRTRWGLRSRRIRYGKRVVVKRDVEFKMTDNAEVEFGDDCIIERYAFFLMTKPAPRLLAGCHVAIGRGCEFYIKGTLRIGDYTRIGSGVIVRDHTHQYSRDKLMIETTSRVENITIGRDVWIGDCASVLLGVSIGDGAVVSTRSVVTQDVEPYTVVAGYPARPIAKRL